MGYLLAFGVIVLVFGLSLLFAANVLAKVGAMCNQVILYLDEKLQPWKFCVGMVLVVVAAWLIYVVSRYPELEYLNAIGIVCLFFGLLFMFLPNWLAALSSVSNRVIFSTDEVILGSRKIFGIILLIISIYIFYAAYAIR